MLRPYKKIPQIPRRDAPLGSDVGTPVESIGLLKPEMTILVGLSICATDNGEGVGLGQRHQFR
jgi:hypothetical protein